MNDEQLKESLKDIDPLCAEHDSIVDQLELVTTDRDIKAANLQLLVEKVSAFADNLDFDALRSAVDLARSLKQ